MVGPLTIEGKARGIAHDALPATLEMPSSSIFRYKLDRPMPSASAEAALLFPNLARTLLMCCHSNSRIAVFKSVS